MAWFRGKLAIVLLVFQAIFLILFGTMVVYDDAADARHHSKEGKTGGHYPLDQYYAMFQDVHVMIFIGFGFLMTFLHKYAWSSVGFNFLIGAFILEWATLMRGFLELHDDGKIHINIHTMLTADFTAAAVLISFGAVLGKISPLQLIIMGFVEVIFAAVNEYIVFFEFGANDVGGSMVVHAFGAYFGLTVARILAREESRNSPKESTTHTSDLFSIIGTVFLWMFWPSFNSALAHDDARYRAVLNTYYSLAACTIVTFAFSSLVNKEGKIEMEHIQNATLAGGVAVGTTADMMIEPWGAVLIGCVAAVVSVLGFTYISPWMSDKLKIHDTCGVNNLHGMPAIIAGLGGAVAAAMADESLYKDSLYDLFGGRAPDEDAMGTAAPETRSASGQAGYQLASLALSIAFAIVGGVVTGFILKLPIWNEPEDEELFDDIQNWELPEDEESGSDIALNGKPLKQDADDKV